MSHAASQGCWVSLLEYANQKNVSMSTLRRYIKSGKIEYRVDQGRYLVWIDSIGGAHSEMETQLRHMEKDLHKAREEIAEMKMLIALYEEKIAPAR